MSATNSIRMTSQLDKIKHVNIDGSRTQNLVRSSSQFITVTLKLIKSAVSLKHLTPDRAKKYIKEVLHSIFFLGHIDRPSIEPDDVLPKKFLPDLKSNYRDVFEQYKTHLPQRPPYSVLLDVVVEIKGDKDVKAVLDQLWNLNKEMILPAFPDQDKCGNDFFFASTVVNYCYFLDFKTKQKTRNYFGGSVSCKGLPQREIFIDLSCINTWNTNVSFAVSLATIPEEKKKTVIGIPLPQYVYSAAFYMINFKDKCDSEEIQQGALDREDSWTGYGPKPPCLRCLDLFPNIQYSPKPLKYNLIPRWEYGNCAECESVSKMLNSEEGVNNFVTDKRNKLDPEFENSWERLLSQKKERLAKNLEKNKFELGSTVLFYDPSVSTESTACFPAQQAT